MPSAALHDWDSRRSTRLGQLLDAHAAVEGSGPGRRYRTEQINRSLLIALVGEFQGFCRDLHDEAADVFAEESTRTDPRLQFVIRDLLTRDRSLDRGNPHADTLRGDFGRFGFDVVSALRREDVRAPKRVADLNALVRLRNALAHADEARIHELSVSGLKVRKGTFVRLRSKLGGVADGLDTVVAEHLGDLFRTPPPW